MGRIALLLSLLVAAAAQAGQLYRWVDQDGRVHYSDLLPPPEAQGGERKRLGDKPPAPTLPYAVQEAARSFPVTLYTAEGCGEGCKQAVAYLTRRGTPFTEKDAREPDNSKVVMSLAGGRLEVPLLTVGRTSLRGYEEGAWATALDAAGYPRTSTLPPGLAARQADPKASKAPEPTAPAPADGSQPNAEPRD